MIGVLWPSHTTPCCFVSARHTVCTTYPLCPRPARPTRTHPSRAHISTRKKQVQSPDRDPPREMSTSQRGGAECVHSHTERRKGPLSGLSKHEISVEVTGFRVMRNRARSFAGCPMTVALQYHRARLDKHHHRTWHIRDQNSLLARATKFARDQSLQNTPSCIGDTRYTVGNNT